MSKTRCDVLTATSLATQASGAKQQQNVNGVGKLNTKSSVMDPRYALTAMVLMLHLPKSARSGRRRRRFSCEKHISFHEASQLVEAKFPSTTLISAVSFADVLNRKKSVKSVVCQTELTWVSSDTPVRTVPSVCVSGSPGSVSTDARALCESA